MSVKMKTLTMGSTTYEIVDEEARKSLEDGAITEPQLNSTLLKKIINKDEFYSDKTETVKSSSDLIDGHTYVGFSGGTIFDGNEVYVNRYGYEHVATTNDDYGKIGFVTRNSTTGEFSSVTYLSVDNSINAYDLRDPNIVVLDGYEDKLILSCFGLIHNEDGTTSSSKSFMFVLDSTFNVLSWCQINGILFWGNTLLTPNGYIIHAAYGTGVKIYRSDTIFNGSINGVTFEEVATVNSTGTEPTIGYINAKLICFMRINSKSSLITQTSDLEGSSGWGNVVTQNGKYYAPCILTSYEGRFCPFTATEQTSFGRFPIIGTIDMKSLTIRDYNAVDDDPCEVAIGGYTTFVPLGNGIFGIMWFMEDSDSNSTNVFYKKINFDYRNSFVVYNDKYDSAIIITENEDCNNMTDAGVYCSQSASVSRTLSNAPVTVAFRMDVEYLNNMTNISQTIKTNNNKIYYRTAVYSKDNDVWTFTDWSLVTINMKAYDNSLGNCDNATEQGILYRTGTTTTNSPITGGVFIIEYKKYNDNFGIQFAYRMNVSSPNVYSRTYRLTQGWGSWYQFGVTEL